MEDINEEYDPKLLDSMEDIYERETDLLNKSDESDKHVKREVKKEVKNENKQVDNKKEVKVEKSYITTLKMSLMKYRNMMLLLLIYLILNMKQLEDVLKNLLLKLKLSDNITLILSNLLKGIILLVVLYLLGIKVLY